MRPRQSSLGNGKATEARYARTPSFNEAEAIKPRKLHLHAPHRGCTPCFNEAEAIKPRKRFDALCLAFAGDSASMRPRQSSLGNPTDNSYTVPGLVLQ